jgi:hypothetical protein
MRKLEALKEGEVQRKGEKKKKRVLWVRKLTFLLAIFFIIPFPLYFKDDF